MNDTRSYLELPPILQENEKGVQPAKGGTPDGKNHVSQHAPERRRSGVPALLPRPTTGLNSGLGPFFQNPSARGEEDRDP